MSEANRSAESKGLVFPGCIRSLCNCGLGFITNKNGTAFAAPSPRCAA
jgi:hypothetical protein